MLFQSKKINVDRFGIWRDFGKMVTLRIYCFIEKEFRSSFSIDWSGTLSSYHLGKFSSEGLFMDTHSIIFY